MARPMLAVGAACALVALWVSQASAWSLRVAVDRTCSASGVQLLVHFSNTEPNGSRAMTVTATDLQTSRSAELGDVAPGHTGEATVDTGVTTLQAGKIRLDISWATGPSGTDRRVVPYGAFGCDPPPAVPEGVNGVTLASIVAAGGGLVLVRRRRTARVG